MADIVTTDQLLAEIADYWNKRPDSNLYKLVDIYNSGFNRIANDLQTVDDWRAIKEAEGTTLDLIGEDEQAYRVTQDDDAYRFWIWIKFLMARAQGTYPSFMKIGSSSLGTDKGFKIWNADIPQHVKIQIPWDFVKSEYMQKFLSSNLQHMLALGYWLDGIVFKSDTPLSLYIGAGTQIKRHKIDRSKTVWWSGWKSRTNDDLHVGIYTQMQRKRHQRSETVWWDGWKAKTSDDFYIGVGSQIRKNKTARSKTIWWTGWKARAPAPAFIAVVGQVIKTQVWHSPVLWADKQTEEVHAGLTIGSKTITQATQSLTTE